MFSKIRLNQGEPLYTNFRPRLRALSFVISASLAAAPGAASAFTNSDDPTQTYQVAETKAEFHYTISDSKKNRIAIRPLDEAKLGFDKLISAADKLNLLKWVRHQGPRELPSEHYNRKVHFGTWVNDPYDQTCYNTRALALMRDSKEPVKFRDNNRCIVDSGVWEDPYTGDIHTSARTVQIDHVVALKNAYMSGAWDWDAKKRCLYANFLGNKFHLLSVDGPENMAKGDRSPEAYLPPNRHYVCEYLQNWLKIKLIWNLSLTQDEADGIIASVREYGCSLKQMAFDTEELSKQRVATEELQKVCDRMTRRIDKKTSQLQPTEDSYQKDEIP
jgi:hypothetical protein